MGTGAAGRTRMAHDINVTPMIDVLLVLLIIFIMALPTMRKAIDVQLSDPNPPVVITETADQIVLEVGPGSRYAINSREIAHDALSTRLHAIYDERPDKVLFVKGSPESRYGDVANAMDIARGSGVLVIGIPPRDIPESK